MIFNELHFFSFALGMCTSVNVLIPQDAGAARFGSDGKKFRVLYLLHGLSDDETIWMRRTSVERYAEQYGVCIVMPRGDRSFYTNLENGSRFYDYISEELPGLMTRFFNVSDRREDNFAAGLSMGGYGALKLVFRSPERYCAAAAFSAVTDWPGISQTMFPDLLCKNYVCPPEDDLYQLLEKYPDDLKKPKLFIGCGTEDVMLPESRNFRDALERHGFDVTYKESPGTHSWDFWDEYIRYALELFF